MKRALSILFAACILPIVAHSEDGSRPGRPPARGPWAENALELSKETLKAVREVVERSREKSVALQERLKVTMSKMQWQVDAKAESREIAATLDEAAKAREALRLHFEKTRSEIDALLTVDQRARLLLAHERLGAMDFGPRGLLGHEGVGQFGPAAARGYGPMPYRPDMRECGFRGPIPFQDEAEDDGLPNGPESEW